MTSTPPDHASAGRLRIGAAAKRLGISPELLRAWEQRYGVLRPVRSPGGFRLYSEDDVARVEAMQRHLAVGVPAAEAARLALRAAPAPLPPLRPGDATLVEERAALLRDLEGYDEAGAQLRLDRMLAAFSIETVIRDVVFPVLRRLGDRWEEGREEAVAREHFSSTVLRGRLLGLARGWDRGAGPRAILACAPAEEHELGLICFGLALRGHGWRITYLGARTPTVQLADAAGTLRPRYVVVAGVMPDSLTTVVPELDALAGRAPLALGGAGASPDLAARVGARLLRGDPVEAAAGLVAAARS